MADRVFADIQPDSWCRQSHPEKQPDEEWESNTILPSNYSEPKYRIGVQAYDIAGRPCSGVPVFRKKVEMATKNNEYSYVRLSGQKEWVLRWQVTKLVTDKLRRYVVAMKADGTWGCACPAWTMASKQFKFATNGVRPDCKHIKMIQGSESQSYINDRITAVWKLKGQMFGSSSSIASRWAADPNEMKAELNQAIGKGFSPGSKTIHNSFFNQEKLQRAQQEVKAEQQREYGTCPDCGKRFPKHLLLETLSAGRCFSCYDMEMRRINEMNALADKVKAQQRTEQAELDSMIVQTKKRVVHIRKRG